MGDFNIISEDIYFGLFPIQFTTSVVDFKLGNKLLLTQTFNNLRYEPVTLYLGSEGTVKHIISEKQAASTDIFRNVIQPDYTASHSLPPL
jgi:hypothetical protein